MESLEEDLHRISARYDLDCVIKRASATPRTRAEPTPNLVDFNRLALKAKLPSDERGRLQFPDYEKFLSDPNLVARLQHVYAPDYDRLGYPTRR